MIDYEIPDFVIEYFKNNFKSRYKQFYFDKSIDQYPNVLKWLQDNHLEPKFIGRVILTDKSNIIPHCPYCGEFLTFTKKYINYAKTCGRVECSNKARVESYQEKYGVEHPLQLEDCRSKQHSTMTDRYGAPYAAQSEICQNHKNQTLIERYGTTNLFSIPEFIEKRKQTWIKKYGADNPMKNVDILKKNQESHSIVRENNRFGPSQMELELRTYLHKTYPDLQLTFNDIDTIGKELDILIPELKLAFEFDGTWWHRADKVGSQYHLNKTQECQKQGISLIHISSDDWMYNNDQCIHLIDSVIDHNEYDVNILNNDDKIELYYEQQLVAYANCDIKSNKIYIKDVVSFINRRDVIDKIVNYFNSNILIFDIDLYHDSILFYPDTYNIVNQTEPKLVMCRDNIQMFDCGSLTIHYL